MAILNIGSRKAQVIVGGQDFSQQLIAFECGDDPIDLSGSGIIQTQGTLTLEGYGNELDDHINTAFAKGQVVTISIPDFQFHSSTLWVREAEYDIENRVQKLQLVDILSLLSQETDDSDKSNVCIGSGRLITEIIQTLLASVGAPALAGTVPGILKVPPKSGNPIKVCGELAFSVGYVLYVSNGEVKAQKIDLNSPAITSRGLDEVVSCKRMSSGEMPPENIIISGTFSKTFKRPSSGMTSIESRDGYFNVTTESFGGNTRTISSTTLEAADKIMGWYYTNGENHLIFSEAKTETWTYQSRAIAKQSEQDECQDNIEKVLLQKETTITRPFGVTLQEWILAHELENKNITYTNLLGGKTTVVINYHGRVIDSREVTSYDFGSFSSLPNENLDSDFQVSEDSANQNTSFVQKISITRQRPQGSIFGKAFKLSGRQVTQPEFPVRSNYSEESWSNKGGEYVKRELEMESWAIAKSTEANALYEQSEQGKLIVPSSTYTGLIVTKDKHNFSGSGSTTPPAPETAPPEYEIKTQNISFKANIKSPYLANTLLKSPPKKYEIPYVIGETRAEWQAQAKELGNVLMGISWGRHKGIEVQDQVDGLGVYRPLIGFSIQGEGRFLADAFAVVVTQNECICKYNGLWVSGNVGSSSSSSSGGGGGGGNSTISRSINVASTSSPGSRLNLSAPLSYPVSEGTAISVASGGQTIQAIASQYVPAGQQFIPLVNPLPAIASGSATWNEPILTPIFELVSPDQVGFGMGVSIRDYDYLLTNETESLAVGFGFGVSVQGVVESLAVGFGFGSSISVAEPSELLSIGFGFGVKTISYLQVLASKSFKEISFSAASGDRIPIFTLLIVDQIRINIITVFPAGWTISIGDDANQDRFAPTTTIDLTSRSITELNPGHRYAIATEVCLYVRDRGTGDGFGKLYLREG